MSDAQLPFGNAPPQSQHDGDLDEDQGGSGSAVKRKRDKEDGSRSKRARYINLACNECKRRKIKCNGETPCHRCGNLKLDCVYEPNCCSGNLKHSSDFKQLSTHVTHLGNQVQYLLRNISHLRTCLGQNDFPDLSEAEQTHQSLLHEQPSPQSLSSMHAASAIDPALQPRTTKTNSPQQTRFQGPTSSAFSLGVAQHSLKHMGITSAEEAIEAGVLSGAGLPSEEAPMRRPVHFTKDPIWELTKSEAVRLCRVFEDENGLLYPILDIEELLKHANLLFQFMDAVHKTFMVAAFPGLDALQDDDTDVLKMVVAIALVTEGGGQSDLGRRLFEQVNKAGDSRMLGSVNLKDIQILTLTAIYHFHSDDEGLAWRVIGMTARLCLELGLHRSETYIEKFPDERERTAAVKLFWSIYVLDHRWSMGTGMSFALQDADLDKNLPTPEDSSPYLATMIQYSRIGTKVWKSVSSTDSSGAPTNAFSKDEAEYLDYQVIHWYQTIPKHLRFMHPESSGHTAQAADNFNRDGGRGLYRLRVLLYLRQVQMRLTIYRPYLHSSSAIAANPISAQTAVDVAKDMIRILRHIDQGSDVYRTQQTTWNHFLLAALAALALAVCHAPAQFSESCREEFLTALEMVRGLSGNSYVSKRLWRTIRNLRELGNRLGGSSGRLGGAGGAGGGGGVAAGGRSDELGGHDQPQNDAQRSAAMAMAGLATGQPVDESAFYAGHGAQSAVADLNSAMARDGGGVRQVTSPNGMATELTNLFEAAGVLGAGGGGAWSAMGDGNGVGGSGHGDISQASAGGGLMSGWLGDSEELGRILRELY